MAEDENPNWRRWDAALVLGGVAVVGAGAQWNNTWLIFIGLALLLCGVGALSMLVRIERPAVPPMPPGIEKFTVRRWRPIGGLFLAVAAISFAYGVYRLIIQP
jgi:hypothetical protein